MLRAPAQEVKLLQELKKYEYFYYDILQNPSPSMNVTRPGPRPRPKSSYRTL